MPDAIEAPARTLKALFGGVDPFPDGLPDAPPWRRFTGEIVGEYVPPELGEKDALRATTFRCDRRLEEAVEAALILRRPLLVTGIPGTGKSSLAYAVAHTLKLGAVLRWNITSRTSLRDGLYDYDALGRLNAAQFQADRATIPPIEEFLSLGPLGTALLPVARPRALLIDELDKSDIDLPNDLLNLFEEGSFEIPELRRENKEGVAIRTADDGTQKVALNQGRIRCRAFPFVVITSNGEREFSAAFLRRCVQYDFPDPSEDLLRSVIDAHLKEFTETERAFALARFAEVEKLGPVATDQLLNALYLIHGKSEGDWDGLCKIVLQQLGRRSG